MATTKSIQKSCHQRIPFIPILLQPVHEVAYFLSPLPICWHQMVGGALRDRSTIVWEDMTMINQPFRCPMPMPKDGTPNIYRDDAGHDGHIYIEIYWVHSSRHLFSPLGEEDPSSDQFFRNRLTAPRIMTHPNCRFSSFLCKNWEDFISSPRTLPSASCNVLASASWRFPNLKKVGRGGSNNRSQWDVWLEVTADPGAP